MTFYFNPGEGQEPIQLSLRNYSDSSTTENGRKRESSLIETFFGENNLIDLTMYQNYGYTAPFEVTHNNLLLTVDNQPSPRRHTINEENRNPTAGPQKSALKKVSPRKKDSLDEWDENVDESKFTLDPLQPPKPASADHPIHPPHPVIPPGTSGATTTVFSREFKNDS